MPDKPILYIGFCSSGHWMSDMWLIQLMLRRNFNVPFQWAICKIRVLVCWRKLFLQTKNTKSHRAYQGSNDVTDQRYWAHYPNTCWDKMRRHKHFHVRFNNVPGDSTHLSNFAWKAKLPCAKKYVFVLEITKDEFELSSRQNGPRAWFIAHKTAYTSR